MEMPLCIPWLRGLVNQENDVSDTSDNLSNYGNSSMAISISCAFWYIFGQTVDTFFFFIRTVDTNTVEFYLCIMSIELVEFYFFVNTLRKIYEAATDLSTWPGNLVFHLANKLIVAQRSLDASVSCTSSIHLLFSGWHKLEHTKYFQAYLWKVRVAEYNTFIVNLVL